MSMHPWPRLSEPFPEEALRWHVVEVAPEGASVRLAAHLEAAALRERLDATVGIAGWSLRLTPWGDRTLLAELRVGEVAKSAAARLARGDDEPEAAAAAFSAAAELYGMRPPQRAAPEAWVDADPESDEPLHPPETVPDVPPAAQQGKPRTTASAAPAESGPVSGAEPEGAADAPKPEAQQVIDRLMERLREEGLGGPAARLVTEYGGYGNTTAESRELYARLRKLLLQRESPA